jgi:predicted Na+-dependent transporter
MKMKKDFTKIKNCWEAWRFQQAVYFDLMIGSIKSFIRHFPLGYLNMLVQLIIIVICIPVYLGQSLENWINTRLIVKPTLKAIADIEDTSIRALVAKSQRRAIEEYNDFIRTLVTFFLGVVATAITLYLTTKVFH